VATSDHRPPLAAVAAICEHFTGEIEQVPPAYSAIKITGKRAYDLARAGERVELDSRRVTIHSLALEGGAELQPLESSFATVSGRLDPFFVPSAPLELADC